MKSKGFTLIELLAVITILSLILLITFVSISSIVKNSKRNLHDTQISQIERAAEFYNNKEGLKDVDICVNVSYLIENDYIKQDEITDPKSGNAMDGSVKILYNGKKYSYEYNDKKCLCNAVEENISIDLGTKYECEVSNNVKYNFYVLSDNQDGTINLIMDRNIYEGEGEPPNQFTATGDGFKYKWNISNNNYNVGPVTAMQGIYNTTKDWINVPNMDLSGDKKYIDEGKWIDEEEKHGYGTLETTLNGIKITDIDGIEIKNSEGQTPVIQYETGKPLKARLAKASEVKNLGCNHDINNSCPQWLMSEMYPDVLDGYWLLSSTIYSTNGAYCISFSEDKLSSFPSGWLLGIRPVITVPTSMISK